MATEAKWRVLESNFTNEGGVEVYNSPLEDPYGDQDTNDLTVKETRHVQLGAQYLYNLKEYLVKAGWTVVSSSYRTNYGTGFWSPLKYEDGHTGMDGQFNECGTWFQADSGDKWTPAYGPSGSDPAYSASWSLIYNPCHSVIYPGKVMVSNYFNPSSGLSNAADPLKRKGIYTDPTSNKDLLGRSWCLLRAPDNFQEPGDSTNNTRYHLVLDYAHSFDPTYGVGSTFNTFVNTFYGETTITFGSFMNIVVLPDYNPEDGSTNIDFDGSTYTPSPYKRPSHRNEIGSTTRTATTGLGGKFFRFIGDTTQKHFLNVIYTDFEDEAKKGGTIVLGSAAGYPTFSMIMAPISDPLSQDIIKQNRGTSEYGGEKFFLFWSNIERASSTTDLRKGNMNKVLTGTPSTNLSAGSLAKTIFDANDDYAFLYHYSTYSPDKVSGTKFGSRILNTTAPVFRAVYTGTTAGVSVLLSTSNFSKTTSDYTYMEWPLPLISVEGLSKNFRYAGRMMDIKLGPAGAPDGILAQESGSVGYDRILFSGLWLPYSGSSPLLF